MAAVGMGVGHVRGPLGRGLSQRALRRFGHLVVPTPPRLSGCTAGGCTTPSRADPVIALEPEPVEPDDTMCVILRPATRRGVRTAAGDTKRALRHSATLDRLAQAIDEAAAATGLTPRFVAFQASRDGPLHEALASRLTAPAETVAPTLHNILTETGRSRVVVTMRYHGAVAALLHSRPAVLLNCSPKLASLASEGGRWARLLDLDQLEERRLGAAVSHALASDNRAPDALAALRTRLAANDADVRAPHTRSGAAPAV